MNYLDKLLDIADSLGARLYVDPNQRVELDAGSYEPTETERALGYHIGGKTTVNPETRDADVYLGGWEEAPELVYIIGLHELGHVATVPRVPKDEVIDPFDMILGRIFGFTPEVLKFYELEAWRWAAQHLSPELLDLAREASERALSTYHVEPERIQELHREWEAVVQS